MAKQGPIKVELIEKPDDPDVLAAFNAIEQKSRIGNIHRVIANARKVFPRYIAYVQSLRHDTKLPAADRELAILCVLERHRGSHEIPPHRMLARTLGLSEEQITGVSRPEAPGLFSDRQRAILRYAACFAADPSERDQFDDSGITSFLDSQELVELGLTLALYLGISHFTALISVPQEDLSQPIGKAARS